MLYSKVIGEGTPFVILHGFLGMGDNWKTLGRQFATLGYEVHLLDQRNHGRSFQSEAFDYEVLVEDLKVYLDKKHITSAVILGHSMGGKTAMLFSTTYPERTGKLIVADIAPRFYPQHHQEILDGLAALATNDEALKGRKEADEFLATRIADWGTRQFLLKNLYWEKPNERLGLRMNLSVLSEKVDEIGQPLPTGAVYDGPTLFLRGDRSEYIVLSDEMGIKSAFAKAHIETIPNAGHWLHAENPKAFFDAVRRFLMQ